MNTAEDYQLQSSRKDLASGILKQAAIDLRRVPGATSGVEREFYLDACRWVISDDCSWPFSFLNVCQLLDLRPEVVREEILGHQSLGPVGYWSRRCGLAAVRLKTFLGNIFTVRREKRTHIWPRLLADRMDPSFKWSATLCRRESRNLKHAITEDRAPNYRNQHNEDTAEPGLVAL